MRPNNKLQVLVDLVAMYSRHSRIGLVKVYKLDRIGRSKQSTMNQWYKRFK